MAAADLTGPPVLNFQSWLSLAGRVSLATPSKLGVPRNMGQLLPCRLRVARVRRRAAKREQWSATALVAGISGSDRALFRGGHIRMATSGNKLGQYRSG